MKKIYLTIVIILINIIAFGQYSFNVSMSYYQPLQNPISVNNGISWNKNSSFPIYFNFNFSILNQTYTALNVMAGGGLSFPGLGTKQLRVFSHPDSGYLLSDRDSNNSVSPISYEIEGIPGQSILKIQWLNAGFREWCVTSNTNDYVDFQIWLYEGLNRIEVHFGNYLATAGAYGQPNCNSGTDGTQFIFEYDNCNNALSLTGPCSLPSYDFRNHCIWQPGVHISGTPSSGIVYNLVPLANSIYEELTNNISIYPNPTSNTLTIETNSNTKQNLEIVNLLGQTMYTLYIYSKATVDVSAFPKGIYLIKLNTDKGIVVNKFVKE